MSKIRLTALATALAIATAPALARDPQVFHCSTTGSDSNPGTEALPFKTPTYAMAQATTVGDEVRFASGTYLFSEPAVISNKNIRIVGAADRSVVFDGQNTTRILVEASNSVYVGIEVSGITFRNGRHSDANDHWAQMKTLGGAVRLVGAIQSGEGSITDCVVTNCAFENCSSDYGGGGALYVCSGSTVVDCSFENCSGRLAGTPTENQEISPGGGALNANTAKADVTVLRCSFTGNVCSNGVGAIGSTGSNLNIATNAYSVIVRDCGFTNNVSYGYAGCLGLKARVVENCTFKGNECRGVTQKNSFPRNSGGVFAPEQTDGNLASPATVRFSGCRFEGNKTVAGQTGGGGAIASGGSLLIVATNCVFTGNASSCLGNVYLGTASKGGGLHMEDCVVSGNYSIFDGDGAVYHAAGTINSGTDTTRRNGVMRLIRTKFIGNSNCGAAGVLFSVNENTQVIDCEFRANVTTRCGFPPATIHFQPVATDVLVRGCLFAANTNNAVGSSSVRFGYYNGTATTGNDRCVVESCTFVGNRSTGTAGDTTGAICFRNSETSDFIVRNCVFWDNHSTANTTLRNFATLNSGATAAAASYCWEDGSQLVTGTRNNIAGGTTPNFLDAANGVWIPTAKSPWVNKGQEQAWMAGAFDLRNDRHFPRIYNGSVDMGCYEYSPLLRPTILSIR